jgi:hypothetical protein
MRVSTLVIMSFLLVCSGGTAQESKKSPAAQPVVKPDKPGREELEKAFAEKMSNAALVGHFTDRTRENAKLPREEKYTLGKVAKLQGDYWLIQARIQYGEHDVSLPLSLRVVWAGDTPVITLDKMPIPGFGTFTCRVMIFGDQYAGTWDGGDHGGHLFGKIVPVENKDRDAVAPTKDRGESKKNGAASEK